MRAAMRSAGLGVLMLAIAAIGAGCGGPFFGVNLFVVGEQTSLEKQVLGTYSALGEDLLVYSSVRAVAPDGSLATPAPATDSQQAAFQAMRNREYNRDDIERMLRLGVVGEENTGLLGERDFTIPVPNLETADVRRLVDEENADRRAILERLGATALTPGEDRRAEVAWIFARLNQDAAPVGAWIQDRTGNWGRK